MSEGFEISAKMAVMSTREQDWPLVSKFVSDHHSCVAAYGVHPWHAHDVKPGWEGRLRGMLQRQPYSILGEIGLDKSARPPGARKPAWDAQLMVFKQQMQIGAELCRPASIHCVKAPGAVIDSLRDLPSNFPAVAIHSYSCNTEMIQAFRSIPGIGKHVYFGFSKAINLRKPKEEVMKVIAAVPSDYLLLESDIDEASAVDADLRSMVDVIAEAKGWSHDQVAEKTWANAKRFMSTRPR